MRGTPLASACPDIPAAEPVRLVAVEMVESSRLPRLWGAKELAEHWQVSRRQIYRMHAEGKLPGIKVLGVLRFREEDLLRLLQEGAK